MRRGGIIGFIVSIVVLILIEVLAYGTFQHWVRTLKPSMRSALVATYIVLTISFYTLMIGFPQLRGYHGHRTIKGVITIILFGFVFFKLFVAAISAIDWIKRFVAWLIVNIAGAKNVPAAQNAMSRSTFIRNAALLVGGGMYATILYGASNRYNYKVCNVKVPTKGLPPQLAALRIVQISDVHSGSFTDVAAVQKGIDMINALQPDLIFFTGDLVNNYAAEMKDYIAVFAQLKAKYGVYSITGNHDYADYVDWDSQTKKQENFQQLIDTHKQMGWRLLLNENAILDINGAALAIVGVQNIGGRGFQVYGSLPQALKGCEHVAHKILLSHDPSHWNSEVKEHYNEQIQLTLSGHTHGMQFGIEIPGIKWSPVQYVYKQWAGLYKHGASHLYVNRGFGFLGYPGRVGILPEITLLQMESAV